jgi:hypothetical protein
MKNSTIEIQSYTDNCLAPAMPRTANVDHDIPEMAIGFGRVATQQSGQSRRMDFGTTTLGEVTFHRVDPLREPFKVADGRLQSRLESLCETLRAKY